MFLSDKLLFGGKGFLDQELGLSDLPLTPERFRQSGFHASHQHMPGSDQLLIESQAAAELLFRDSEFSLLQRG